MVLFESLGTVSCLHFIATMAVSLAVSKIFSVKEWRDLGNVDSGSFKVTENCAVRWTIYDLVLVSYYKYRSVLYHFRDKTRSWSKIAIFFRTSCIRCRVRESASEYCHIVWYGKAQKVWGYVSTECRRVTDRGTDRRTDRRLVTTHSALRVTSRCNNVWHCAVADAGCDVRWQRGLSTDASPVFPCTVPANTSLCSTHR